MSTDARVSCVIPVYNGARFIGEAIESVLGQQGCRQVEIIVVDDGSTDSTQDVVSRFSAHVSYVHQPNGGSASARNTGIKRSSAEFVALLDADDLWLPEKVAKQLARFREMPKLAICTTHMRNFWAEEVAHEVALLEDDRLTEVQPNLGSAFMARRSLFDTVGMLDTNFRHRDVHDLVVRANDSGLSIEVLPDVLVHRRIHDANVSRDRSDAGELELLAIARARVARRRQSMQ